MVNAFDHLLLTTRILCGVFVFFSVLCILVLPFTISSVFLSKWVFSDAWCHIEGFLLTTCVVATQLSLTIIAVDRNYAIINSLRYPYVFTQKRCHIILIVLWVLSVSFSIPPLAGFGAYRYLADQNTCSIDWSFSSEFSVMFLCLTFLLPLLTQSWCYLAIFKAAINHTKRSIRVFPSMSTNASTINKDYSSSTSTSELTETSTSGTYVTYKNMECKAIRTIMFIAGSYAICWVPYLVSAIYSIIGNQVTYDVGSLTVVMVFLNTSIDPLIYAFMNRIMRYEIYKFYCDSLNKMSERTSYDDSDDGLSSTNITMTSSRTSRNSSFKSRVIKTGTPGRIEMNPIKEESETAQEPYSQRNCTNEILLSPRNLIFNRRSSSATSTNNRHTTTADIHHPECSVQSRQNDRNYYRSKSEIWSARAKKNIQVTEQDSFLFFKLGNEHRQRSKSMCSPRKKKTRIKTICDNTSSSTTRLHNETSFTLEDIDIVAEFSIDVRKKKAESKDILLYHADRQTLKGNGRCFSA